MSKVKGYDVYLNDRFLGFVRGRNQLSRGFALKRATRSGFGIPRLIWEPLEPSEGEGLFVLDDAAQELKLVEVTRLRETLNEYLIKE